jgi:hypothetical protein
MADPRTATINDGTGYAAHTFMIDDSTITYDETADNGSAQVGLAVTFSADNTVALTADGETVVGKLLKVEADGKATVQTDGITDLPAGTSANVTAGRKIFGALLSSAKGYIRGAATASASPTQAEVNDALRSRHMILTGATTTAVRVKLG